MANNKIQPDVGNLTGLLQADAKIGTQVTNARVAVTNVYSDDNLVISFVAKYFWNNAAYVAWKADHTAVQPFFHTALFVSGR